MTKGTPALSQIIWLEQQIAALENEMQVMSDKLTCALLEAKENEEIAYKDGLERAATLCDGYAEAGVTGAMVCAAAIRALKK